MPAIVLGAILRGLLRAGAGNVGRIALTARGGRGTKALSSSVSLRAVGRMEDNTIEALRLALLFRRYLRIYLRENLLRVKEKSPFTMLVQKQSTNRPLVNTGALIQKYVTINTLTNGFSVGFDMRRVYTEGEESKPIRDLLDVLERGGVAGRDPGNKKKIARWMAIQMRKAGMPRGKSQRRVYRVPARPFFARVTDRFIRDMRDSGRTFKVSGYRLYIYVNRKGNTSTSSQAMRGGAEG